MNAGKPQKQSLAIAYSMKRKAKKMAMGGDAVEYDPKKPPPSPDPTKVKSMGFDIFKADGGFIGSHQPADKVDTDPDLAFHDDELEHGYVDHMGNTQRPNGKAMSDDDRKLNQHGEIEEGPQGMYADGGGVWDSIKSALGGSSAQAQAQPAPSPTPRPDPHALDPEKAKAFSKVFSEAEGGEIKDPDMDMVGRIMKKRQQMFANGGLAGLQKPFQGDSSPAPAAEPASQPTQYSLDQEAKRRQNANDLASKYAAQDAAWNAAHQKAMQSKSGPGYAAGGSVERIMRKRDEQAQGYSEGGKVANQDEIVAGFDPNEFDDLHLRDDLEFNYTGANSGDEIDNDRENKDREDIVARIMRSRAKKDRMPRPA